MFHVLNFFSLLTHMLVLSVNFFVFTWMLLKSSQSPDITVLYGLNIGVQI